MTENRLVILPQRVARCDGVGGKIAVGPDRGKLLVLTLVISQVVELEGLTVSVWGSSDGRDWGSKPLLRLPQKYYCGTYSTLLRLAKYPAVRYLRVRWKVKRRRQDSPVLSFVFSVFTERSGSRVQKRVALRENERDNSLSKFDPRGEIATSND
jgi:hypothetical protein